jgi:hypothetical protein
VQVVDVQQYMGLVPIHHLLPTTSKSIQGISLTAFLVDFSTRGNQIISVSW